MHFLYFGSGTVLVPWSIILAINGNLKFALSIITLYAIIMITRQLIEPRIVSNKIGIHPIFTLIAMYTGFKVVGIIGLLVGPIILIILKNIYENILDDGIVKSILK